MPRHKTDRERGYYGVWLRAGREKLGWTQKEVVAWLQRQGVTLNDNYYRQVESGPGRRFGEDVHPLLVELFGSEPQAFVEEPQTTNDDLLRRLIEVMERQTLALEALAQRMSEERDDAPAWAEAVVQAVLAGRQLVSGATERDEPQGSDVPRRGRG